MLDDTTIHKNWIVLINQVILHGKLRKGIGGSTTLSLLEQEILWQESMVENLIYCERIIDLLNRKGFKPNIKFRLSPEGISPHPHHCHPEQREDRGSPQPQSSLASAELLSAFEDDFEERLNMDEKEQPHSDTQLQTPQGNTATCLNVRTSEKMKNYYRDELKMSQGKAKYYLYEHDCLLFGFYENGNWSFGIKDQGPRPNGKEVSIHSEAGFADGMTNVHVRKAEYPL
ncbi:uncharacterized protein LOC131883501 [Tigriopus californicus]|nr:uncharacterized protein LOC131883501 [Tigriopus californicus]